MARTQDSGRLSAREASQPRGCTAANTGAASAHKCPGRSLPNMAGARARLPNMAGARARLPNMVHVPGVGDFQPSKIELLPDPHAFGCAKAGGAGGAADAMMDEEDDDGDGDGVGGVLVPSREMDAVYEAVHGFDTTPTLERQPALKNGPPLLPALTPSTSAAGPCSVHLYQPLVRPPLPALTPPTSALLAEADELGNEQTWPTEAEMVAATVARKVKRPAAGTGE
eukprot:7377517-Prymnesium_polylepis.1